MDLRDKLVLTGVSEEDLADADVVAQTLCILSEQVPFILSGEEFLRTKGGNSNSYNASYKVNELDYALKVKHPDMIKNYQALIDLKTHNSEFAYDETGVAENVTVETNDNYIKLTINGSNPSTPE